MTDSIETQICATGEDCGVVLDEDEGVYFSQVSEKAFCFGCMESDMQHASTLIRFDLDGMTKVRFSDEFVITETDMEIPDWFNKLFGEAGFKGRVYTPTDGWRGYYDTEILMTELESLSSGWTTGWSDETTTHKADFNEFGEFLNDGEVLAPRPIYFLFEPTSNVFSISSAVLCGKSDIDIISGWLDSIGYPIAMLKEQLA